MNKKDLPFYTQTAVLDTYLKTDVSTQPQIVEVIAKSIKNKIDLYTYFFNNRPHKSWAKALFKYDFFKTAPDPVKSGDGYRLPLWAEQEYLISIANEVPDVLTEHIKILQGHSIYKNRAITALRQASLEVIEKVMPTVINWLENEEIPSRSYFETLELIETLANHKSEFAFSVFQIVTTPSPNPLNKPGRYFYESAVATFPLKDYLTEKSLISIVSILQKLDLKRTITILEAQICEALRLEAESQNDKYYKSTSWWRTAIEETGQDRHPEFKDELLRALRDLLEQEVQNNSQNIKPIIERYLNGEFEILQRLGLHILSQFPKEFKGIVSQQLLNPENLDDIGIHHEFFILLKNGFSYLERNEQGQLVNSIIIGLPKEKLDRISQNSEIESDEERDNYVKNREKSWIYKRLWMLQDNLEGEAKELLNSLISEFGELENPSFTHWTSEAYFVSDVSPMTAQELKQKSDKELLDYLRNWKPRKDNYGPTEETFGALGGQIANLFSSDFNHYEPLAYEIASMHSSFASALINSQTPKSCSFEDFLGFKLGICEKLLENKKIRTTLEELPSGRWQGFRFSITRIIEEIFNNQEINLSEKLLSRIRDLLLILTNDPDPNLENDRPKEGWFGHNDPMTVSINHVRPEAIELLIRYSVKISNKDVSITDKMDSKVKEVLTEKVKRSNDFSLAVHSVFGRELYKLYWLNRKWIEENIDEIFPNENDEVSIAFYVSAWDSWVTTGQIALDLFELLRPKYERAIENISKGYLTKTFNPIEGLSHHLIMEYQLATYEINSFEGQNSLIATFFKKVSPKQRGTAVRALNQRINEKKKQQIDEWQRTKEFWAWRVAEALKSNHNSEFVFEMEAFSLILLATPEKETINSLWSLLECFLSYLNDSKDWNRIWNNLQEYLSKEVERNPVEVIRFYNMMHDVLSEPRQPYEYLEKGRKILEKGASFSESRLGTLSIIDKLCRIGNYQFQDIQEQILSEQ